MLLSASNASEVGSDRIRERQSAGLESGAAAELPAAGASERRAVREMQWHWVAIMEAHGEWRGIRDEHAVFLPTGTGRGGAVNNYCWTVAPHDANCAGCGINIRVTSARQTRCGKCSNAKKAEDQKRNRLKFRARRLAEKTAGQRAVSA